MSRTTISLLHAVTVAAAFGALALTSPATQAAPACNNATFVGTYYFTTTQIEVSPNGTDYCDEYGTAAIDGTGHISTSSKRRCSLSGNATGTGRNLYQVSPDCSVIITDINDDGSPGQKTHGRILMNGDMVLVDGTTRTDNTKIFHAVGVRTGKAKPTLPTKKKP